MAHTHSVLRAGLRRLRRNARTVRHGLAAAIITAGVFLGSAQQAGAAWERAHADGANRGFVNVTTAPAGRRSRSFPGLGTFAPGSGPVIAPDGTVFMGTLEGKLVALHADGSPFWSRDIAGQKIVASPAVGADGSIYVIGIKRLGKGKPTLHIFTSGGGYRGPHAFPERGVIGALTRAPPNIVHIGSLEVVLIPVVYRERDQPHELRVVGFSTAGSVVIDELVAREGGGAITGTFCEFLDACYDPPRVPLYHPGLPMPGVAVFTFPNDGSPHVIVTEGPHRIHGFVFSAKPALTRTFHFLDEKRTLLSPPMVLPDGHTLVGTDGGVVFAGPNRRELPALTSNLGTVFGAPTLLADGRAAVVDNGPNGAGVALIQDGKHVGGRSFPGRSMVSAAASRTHLFVSTSDAFYTLDSSTLKEVGRIDLLGGGASTPAIGPRGHVYTIASNILFVFPPPRVASTALGGSGSSTVQPTLKPQAGPH